MNLNRSIGVFAFTLIIVFIVFAFAPPDKPKKIEVETAAIDQIQAIVNHSISILDNGAYRNNYDSVKSAIVGLSSVYQYLDNLKKDTTQNKK